MLSEVINSQGLTKAICKYISSANSFNHKFAIIDQHFDLIVLDINVFGLELAFSIFDKDNASFVIFV